MTEGNGNPAVPEPIASTVYDDDDLIDYDDDEIEPASLQTKQPETIVALQESGTKPTSLDKGLDTKPAPAQETTTASDTRNDIDEIDYDDDEDIGDNGNGVPVPHQQAAQAEEEQVAMQPKHQEDEEIDFSIGEENTAGQENEAMFVENTSLQHYDGEVGGQNESDVFLVNQVSLVPVPEAKLHNVEEKNGVGGAPEVNTQADQAQEASKNSQADAAEKDEITWEEPEDQLASEEVRQADQLDTGNKDASGGAAQYEAAQPFVAAEQVEFGDQADEETNSADEHEFPAITVQYKGEEFPLCSITSEGFFTSTSVLDQNIGSLFAGLRKELADEIPSEDELVFQVDELGLEYAESNSEDVLGNVTLTQILEIFELLVKNQDPDSDRALYTYLFTKSSTTKRFESLIESAAAGTGLNEVVYHFDSPVPHGTNQDGDHLTSSHHNLDAFETPDYAGAEAHGQTNNDQEEYDYIDDLDDTTQANTGGPGVDEEARYGEAEAGNVAVPHDSLPDSGEEHLVATIVQPVADAEANAFTDNDFEMAMDPDVDNTAEEGDFDAKVDLTDEYAGDALHLANTGTSASNTVDIDDSGPDMTAEQAAEAFDQFDEAKIAGEDDDEIDWREDPADQDTSTMSAGTAKRSLNTDGVDQENGPDPKRQRS